jgi:hypothetical protein
LASFALKDVSKALRKRRNTMPRTRSEFNTKEVKKEIEGGQASSRSLRDISPEAPENPSHNFAEYLTHYDWRSSASKKNVLGPSSDPHLDSINCELSALIDYHNPDTRAEYYYHNDDCKEEAIRSLADLFVDRGTGHFQSGSQKRRGEIKWPKITENQHKAIIAELKSRAEKSPEDPRKITQEMLTLLTEKTAVAASL